MTELRAPLKDGRPDRTEILEQVRRSVHVLAASATEGELRLEEGALLFKTDPSRYRKLRIVCTAVGTGFLLMGVLAVFQDLANLGGAAVAVAIGVGLLFLGLSPAPAMGLRVDAGQIALIRTHGLGTDRAIYPAERVQKLLVWTMHFGQKQTARAEWGLGAKLDSGDVLGLFRARDSEEINRLAQSVRRILARDASRHIPVEEAASAQGW